MGRSIYFTDKEINAVRASCNEWLEVMGYGEDTITAMEERLNGGLGSALKKLHKGCVDRELFKEY